MSATHGEPMRTSSAKKRRTWVLALAGAPLALCAGLGIDYLHQKSASRPRSTAAPSIARSTDRGVTSSMIAFTVPMSDALAAARVPAGKDGDRPPDGRGGRRPSSRLQVSAASGYFVQVRAVPDPQHAQRLLQELNAIGFSVYITSIELDQVRLYRVRVGPWRSWESAKEATRRLGRKGYTSTWITN
jgi:cell division protein FtsN